MKFCRYAPERADVPVMDIMGIPGLVIGEKVYPIHALLTPGEMENVLSWQYPEVNHPEVKELKSELHGGMPGLVIPDVELHSMTLDLLHISHWPKHKEIPNETSVKELKGVFLDQAKLTAIFLTYSSFRDFYSFEAHVKTARAARGLEMAPEWYDFPVFYFSNTRCIIAHEQELTVPIHGKCLDYELEVAAIIGTECRDIPADEAESVIAGYTILNDWSLRDLQREEVKVGLGPAKGKDFATSLGPYLVTPDELERRRSGKGFDLQMVARVNGVELSRGNWKDIHYSFGEMIARASDGVTIYPGEVIGSGTVGTGCILELGADNVAKKLGRENGWLQAGDLVELEVEGLGTLRNEIVQGG